MRSKSASRSARGEAQSPVMAPEPLALPAISSGPASNGPWVVQSNASFRVPSSPICPLAPTLAAAPTSRAVVTEMTPPP